MITIPASSLQTTAKIMFKKLSTL